MKYFGVATGDLVTYVGRSLGSRVSWIGGLCNSLGQTTDWSIRNRCPTGANNGFVWENNAEQIAMSLNGNSGDLHLKGTLYCANIASTSTPATTEHIIPDGLNQAAMQFSIMYNITMLANNSARTSFVGTVHPVTSCFYQMTGMVLLDAASKEMRYGLIPCYGATKDAAYDPAKMGNTGSVSTGVLFAPLASTWTPFSICGRLTGLDTTQWCLSLIHI